MVQVQNTVLMTEVGRCDQQWTRAVISKDGRIYASFPRWHSDGYVQISVGRLTPPSKVEPYPDESWNSWKRGMPTVRQGLPAGMKFVCVQSVFLDDQEMLWVLDSANPSDLDSGGHGQVLPGGPRLFKFDTASDSLADVYLFSPETYFPRSYFNDVRIDTKRNKAFITDSGRGGLVVLDLATGNSWRLLDQRDSVNAEAVELSIEGAAWLNRNGKLPSVHSDGLDLSPDREYLYYQALTGRTLYRVPTKVLVGGPAPPEAVEQHVVKVGETGAADGIHFGADGHLYLTALEENAINRLAQPYDPGGAVEDGRVERVIGSDRLKWPDSITVGPDDSLYVTTSRIHLAGPSAPPPGPFQLFRLQFCEQAMF